LAPFSYHRQHLDNGFYSSRRVLTKLLHRRLRQIQFLNWKWMAELWRWRWRAQLRSRMKFPLKAQH